MKRASVLLCALFLISVIGVKAVSSAEGDASSVQSFLREMQEEEILQAQEDREQAGSEFFPSAGGREEDASRFGDFVTVTWRGTVYDLKDVPRQAWFAPSVRDLVNRGIVSGYSEPGGKPLGSFGPMRPVSVEEIAKMTLAAAGVDTSSCAVPPRTTLAVGRWSERFVACAEERKYTLFTATDEPLDVRRPAYRGEVVMTLLEAFGVLPPADAAGSGTVIPATGSGAVFSDLVLGTPASAAIIRAFKDSIVAGYMDEQGNPTGTFGPGREINRAEASKMISLALQVYAKSK